MQKYRKDDIAKMKDRSVGSVAVRWLSAVDSEITISSLKYRSNTLEMPKKTYHKLCVMMD